MVIAHGRRLGTAILAVAGVRSSRTSRAVRNWRSNGVNRVLVLWSAGNRINLRRGDSAFVNFICFEGERNGVGEIVSDQVGSNIGG